MASQQPSAAGDGGSPKSPPRRVDIVVTGHARREGREILTPGQYEHVKGIVKRLVDFNNPPEINDLRIEAIENFFELKEKGGMLGRINLRVYFALLRDVGKIVVLKVYKKDEEGRPPRHVIINVQARLRSYLRNESRDDVIYYAANISL